MANARSAIADSRVVAAIAHYSSTSALACVETYRAAGLPIVIWGAGQGGITVRDPQRVAQVIGDKTYKSAMPAHADILSDEQIVAALFWIEAQWPAEIREQLVAGTQ